MGRRGAEGVFGSLRAYGWKVNFHLGAASRRPKVARHAGISRAQIYHVRVLLQDMMESYTSQDVSCMDCGGRFEVCAVDRSTEAGETVWRTAAKSRSNHVSTGCQWTAC
jgi:hypothetical protein